MKLKKRQIIALILLAILLLLGLDLLLRPKVALQSLAEMLHNNGKHQASEKLLNHNAKKDKELASTNLAKSLYKQNKLPEAEAASEAGFNRNKTSNAFYDRGNIAFKQEDYETALKNYRRALLQNPNDKDTKANYELTQRKLQNQPPPQPQTEQDKQKQEEIRNILGGLDNKESSDRKQQNQNNINRNSKWW